jgi:hypothetical protein
MAGIAHWLTHAVLIRAALRLCALGNRPSFD